MTCRVINGELIYVPFEGFIHHSVDLEPRDDMDVACTLSDTKDMWIGMRDEILDRAQDWCVADPKALSYICDVIKIIDYEILPALSSIYDTYKEQQENMMSVQQLLQFAKIEYDNQENPPKED